jgi:hypothetical protein
MARPMIKLIDTEFVSHPREDDYATGYSGGEPQDI